MTDCEKCPYWRPDESTGGYNCQTRYCIDDPMAGYNEEQDAIWDDITKEREAYDQEMAQEAYWATREAMDVHEAGGE